MITRIAEIPESYLIRVKDRFLKRERTLKRHLAKQGAF